MEGLSLSLLLCFRRRQNREERGRRVGVLQNCSVCNFVAVGNTRRSMVSQLTGKREKAGGGKLSPYPVSPLTVPQRGIIGAASGPFRREGANLAEILWYSFSKQSFPWCVRNVVGD